MKNYSQKHGILQDDGIFPFQKMTRNKWNRFLLSNAFNVYNMEVLKHSVTKS